MISKKTRDAWAVAVAEDTEAAGAIPWKVAGLLTYATGDEEAISRELAGLAGNGRGTVKRSQASWFASKGGTALI